MNTLKLLIGLLVITSISAHASKGFDRSPESITAECAAYMEVFDKNIAALVAEKSKASYKTVFEPFDNHIMNFVDDLLHDYLMQNTHPDSDIRKASTDCALKGFAALNGLNANRPLYDRMSLVKTKGLPADKAFTVNYWTEQFQQSGIGKNEKTRNEIKILNDEISQVGNTFKQNITDAVDSITVKQDRLHGVPQDYIDSHPADEKGMVTITTAYSDVSPIRKYAHDRALRKDLALLSRNRAADKNPAILLDLLSKRFELAQMLGHENFAELNMLGTMVKTPANVIEFTAKLSAAIKQPALKEKARLLKQMQIIDPAAKQVESWDAAYLKNIVMEKEYKLDAKAVREYFDYDKVRDGIISLSEDLFSITIKSSKGATWHQSVEAYKVYENKKLIGEFYLDSHPREGKYTHAAQFAIQLGKKNTAVPRAALVMNFPKGLMEHGQVETFLHEYGHLIHFIFAGQNDIAYSRFQSESDFGEAPSTMLEEWVWDYDTLSKFAANSKGKAIPKGLVKKMNDARYFGQALSVAGQLTYAALSFDLYNRDPKGLDLDSFEKDIFNRYSPYGYTEGTHMHASFGHLDGYGAKYYTYQWSNSIAEELLSKFKKDGLRNTKTAQEYRHKILASTGTKPAAEAVRDFLGRDFSVEAYAERLSKGE